MKSSRFTLLVVSTFIVAFLRRCNGLVRVSVSESKQRCLPIRSFVRASPVGAAPNELFTQGTRFRREPRALTSGTLTSEQDAWR